MAYLFIDTRQTGASAVRWVGEGGVETWVQEGRAQQLLTGIKAHADRIKAEARGVIVASGPGRFSSIRVGVLYANLIARWFKIPLYEASAAEADQESELQVLAKAIAAGQRPSSPYVAPVYDREPNITTPRPQP